MTTEDELIKERAETEEAQLVTEDLFLGHQQA